MSEVVVARGELSADVTKGSWVLVFGGVTREGNRRARRAARSSIKRGHSVVWFDGFGETFEDEPGQRVPLDPDLITDAVTVVDYSVEERAHWINRMVDSIPSALLTPLEAVEGRSEGDTRMGGLLRRMRRHIAELLRVFRKTILRRVSQIFRGFVGWYLVKRDVHFLADTGSPPLRVVFGDDYAQTQAWHAVRIWPEVEAGMLLES